MLGRDHRHVHRAHVERVEDVVSGRVAGLGPAGARELGRIAWHPEPGVGGHATLATVAAGIDHGTRPRGPVRIDCAWAPEAVVVAAVDHPRRDGRGRLDFVKPVPPAACGPVVSVRQIADVHDGMNAGRAGGNLGKAEGDLVVHRP